MVVSPLLMKKMQTKPGAASVSVMWGPAQNLWIFSPFCVWRALRTQFCRRCVRRKAWPRSFSFVSSGRERRCSSWLCSAPAALSPPQLSWVTLIWEDASLQSPYSQDVQRHLNSFKWDVPFAAVTKALLRCHRGLRRAGEERAWSADFASLKRKVSNESPALARSPLPHSPCSGRG